jgi:phage terminase large subunit-like protein
MIEFTAEQYVDDVLAERVVVCRWVKLACERHRKDLETGEERGLWFDETAAKVAIAFFGVLRHWKGEWAGRVINLEPVQQFWVWSIFGWKRADGTRRFRTAYLEVPRKNTKTTFAAGVSLLLAFVDGEMGAEVYTAATTRDQAKICHKDAMMMVKASPQLQQIVTVLSHNMHDLSSGSKLEPLSSDYNSMDGLNISGLIADELHAWGGVEYWGKLKTATGSRRQPLRLAITTAGVDQLGVCYQQREYLGKILKGLVEDDSFFGMIYTMDTKSDWPDLEADDNWEDEANWFKSNPMLGVSKYLETMREDAREAKNKPAELNLFLRYHLDIWTRAVTRWVNPIWWKKCGEWEFDEKELAGRICYAGLDLSQTFDITAFVLVFPPEGDDEPYKVICRFWLPEENMEERVRKAQVPYDVWVRQGFLKLTPGNVVDYDFIIAEIGELAHTYDIKEVAYDDWGATAPAQTLMDMGGDEWIVAQRQGYKTLSPPMKDLGKKIASMMLAHNRNPVLNWMADNLVSVENSTGDIKPDKARSTEKIDGMVALIMALERLGRGGGVSVYEKRGLLVL